MAGPLLPSTGHCPPCTHGCSQPGWGLTPSPTSLPSVLPKAAGAGVGGPLLPPSLENSHLSPQEPPAKPLRVPPEKAATVEDAAEPGKLVSFVIGVRVEVAGRRSQPQGCRASDSSLLQEKHQRGDGIPALPKFIPNALITAASHQPLHSQTIRDQDAGASPCPKPH